MAVQGRSRAARHDGRALPVRTKKGYRRLASLHGKDAFGQAEEGYLRELAPKYGLELAAVEEFNPEDTNFTAQIVKLKAANPQLIYNGATGRPAILTFKLIQQLQITAPVAVQQAAVNLRGEVDGFLRQVAA